MFLLLGITQSARALTLQEIINGQQGQVLGAATLSVTATANGSAETAVASIATSGTLNVTTGDLLVAVVAHYNSPSRTVSSLSDGTNNFILVPNSRYTDADGSVVEMWYKENATAKTSATFTANLSGTALYRRIMVWQISGAATSGALDQVSTPSSGSSTSQTCSNITTTQADEIMLAGISEWAAHTYTAGSSFTNRFVNGITDFIALDRIVASTGTYPGGTLATASSAADNKYACVMASFKADLSGGVADTTAPTTPTNLSATAISSSGINLSWSASTDAVGVAGYKIYRNGSLLATSNSQLTTFSDSGLSASTNYSYTVAAYDAAGNTSSQSSSANATTQAAAAPDTTAPTVPANLSATAVSSSGINLSWSASTDAVGVTGYKIYRNGSLLATSNSQLTTFSDTGLAASTSYSYTVAAYDAAGNTSAQSTSANATTQAAPVGGSANYYISPSGSDSNSCTSTGSPCLTINGALQKASAGQTIEMAAGTYGAQNISVSKTSPGVTVKCVSVNSGATSNSCKTGAISAGGSWYTIQDVTIDVGDTVHGSGWGASGSNITFKNVKLHGDFAAGYMSAGTSNFTWDGGEWGDQNNLGGRRNCTNQDGYYLYMLGDSTISNITLKNMDVWPQQLDPTPCNGDPMHMETIRIDGNINGMLIDGLNFHDGAQDNTGTIFFSTFRGTPSNVTIQNSYLGTDGNSSIVFGGGTNINIRYNTITGGIAQASLVSGLTVTGNAGWWQSFAGCIGTHVKNVWQWDSNFSCGSDKIVTGPQYSLSNLGLSGGYVVQAGSQLINAGETSCAVSKDILGNSRPSGAACDAGAYEYGGVVSSDTTAPTVPTGLAATAVSTSQINLTWTASTDAVGVVGYKIYRNGSLLTTTNNQLTTYSSTGLTASTLYSYTVAAYDAAGNTSSQSSSASATTQAVASDTTAPTVPTGLSATAVSSSGINLSWTASTDAVGVTGYKIYRGGTQIGISATTSYSDTGLTASTLYSYTVAAYDAAGNTSAQSSSASATTQAVGAGNIRYVSTTGANSSTCLSSSSPCLTVAYAYTQASPGDTIQVASGSYGNVTIAYRSGMSGSPVVVKPATGATINFTDINLLAGDITFQGPNFNARSFDVGCYNCTRISNVVIDNLNIDAQNTIDLTAMLVASVTNLTIKNSKIGNTMAGSTSTDTAKSMEFCGANSTCYAANVLLENNTFYDADAPTGSAAHLECIFATGIQGFTVRKNRFQDCTYFDIFITVILANSQAQPKDYIIEDNLLGQTLHPDGYDFGFAINLHSDVQPNNFIFRRNTIEGAIATANGGGTIGAGGWQITGNIIGQGVYLSESTAQGCRSGITFSYNVMPNSCGSNTTTSNATTIRSGWINPTVAYAGNDDFHLKSTSPAVGKGNPADAGLTDFDSVVRASAPSAGAYEYTGTITPDTTAPTVPTNLIATGLSISSIGLSWTASTDAVGVSGYKIYRNGSLLTTTNSQLTTYSDTGLTVGTSYSYTVSAYDAAGNNSAQSTSASGSTLFNPDTTKPTVSIASPSSGTVSGNITFSATASDPSVAGQTLSGLKLITLYIDGTVYATSSSGSISKTLDTVTLTNASHTLTAQATDNAGNNSTIASVSVTVNNAPAAKYPRLITLTSLEGLSAIPSNQSITVTILSGSTVLETQTLT
ncbi:MAG: hypothetical protein HY973_03870, partial [Candidatus Kerfeldbacteria bacterium]|nr:hypothetical protein [Candidatus Kerfeldbacteria bacterium]